MKLQKKELLYSATPPNSFNTPCHRIWVVSGHSLFHYRNGHYVPGITNVYTAGIALAHYGLVPDHESILEEAEDTLQRWAAVAERAWHDGRDIVEALAESFTLADDGLAPERAREDGDAERHPLQRSRLPPLVGDEVRRDRALTGATP